MDKRHIYVYIYMLILLIAAFLVEICFFNFNYVKGCFTSWDSTTISLTYQDSAGHSYSQLNKGTTTINLPPQDGVIFKSLAFSLASNSHFIVRGSVLVKNDLRRHMFTKAGTFVVSSNGSAFVKINNYAPTYEISIVFEKAMPQPVLLTNLVINQKPSCDFSFLRFALLFLVLAVPTIVLKLKLYRAEFDYLSRKHHVLYWLATLPSFLLVFMVFYYNNSVNGHNSYSICMFPQECTFAFGTNDHSLLRERPKTQQEVYNSHLYDQQFDAFLKGRLSFDVIVNTKLLNEANPYETSNLYRDKVGFLFDRSYYKGNYYSYYGPTPMLMSYLPVYVLTGKFPTPSLTNLILATFASAMMFWGILSLSTVLRLKANLLLILLGSNAAVLASGLLFLQGGLEHYFEVVSAAIGWCCFELVSVCKLLSAQSKGRALLWSGLAALAVVLVEFSRPNLLLVALALLVPVLLYWRSIYQNKRSECIQQFALMAGILVLGAAAQLYFNYARFDHPLQFGQNLALSAYDASKTALISVYLFLDVIQQLFLNDFVYSDEFPFIKIGAMSFEDSGNVRFGENVVGLAPFWLIFGLVFLFLRRLSPERFSRKMNAYLLLIAALGVVTVLFSCMLTDVYTQRYLTEVHFIFTILSLVLILKYIRFADGFSSQILYLFAVGAMVQTCAIGALTGATGPNQFVLNFDGFAELINIFRPFA